MAEIIHLQVRLFEYHSIDIITIFSDPCKNKEEAKEACDFGEQADTDIFCSIAWSMLNCPRTCKRSCRFGASLQPEIMFTPPPSQPIEYHPTKPNNESFGRIKPIHESSTECPSTQSCKSNHTNPYDDDSGKISFKDSFEGRHITFLT